MRLCGKRLGKVITNAIRAVGWGNHNAVRDEVWGNHNVVRAVGWGNHERDAGGR